MTKHAYVYIYTSNKNERIWSKHQTYYKMGGFCTRGAFVRVAFVLDPKFVLKFIFVHHLIRVWKFQF